MYTFSAASSLYFQLSANQAICFGCSLIVRVKEAIALIDIICYFDRNYGIE